MIVRAVFAFILLVAGPLAMPGDTAAHGDGEAFIHVPDGPVRPEDPFRLVGADMGSGADVTLELDVGGSFIRLGSVSADEDGHFETRLIVPASVSDGYVELIARSSEGSRATSWIQLEGAGSAGPRRSGAALDLIPVAIVGLVVAVVVSLIVLGGRRRRVGPVRP